MIYKEHVSACSDEQNMFSIYMVFLSMVPGSQLPKPLEFPEPYMQWEYLLLQYCPLSSDPDIAQSHKGEMGISVSYNKPHSSTPGFIHDAILEST